MSKITVKEFSTNLDKFRVPLSSFEREKRKGLIPYYGAAKIIDYVDGFTHTGLSVLIAEDGSVETKNGYPVVQLANGEYWVNNHTHVLKGGDDIDTTYLYYALQTIKVAPFVTGAVQKKISQQALNSMEIPYFEDKTDRKRIVEILSSFDEKIQLNTQINQTLEQIAQALFKSWFVDFDPVRAKVQALSDGLSLEQAELAAMQAISGKTPEELTALSQTQPDRYAELAETAKAFPCEMVEVDGVEVPRGWEYKPADELFDIGIGKTPLRKETEWFSTNPDDMQWISIKDMGNSGVFITESSELLTNQAVDKFNIRKIPEDTVLLSFKLTIGRVSITMCETTTNEAIAHFKITDKSFLTTEYLYLFFQQFDFNSLGSTSSIATAVNSKTI
ncbi:TPA: restriction endonuclease subunit S, partial [Haemophilus influenzae]